MSAREPPDRHRLLPPYNTGVARREVQFTAFDGDNFDPPTIGKRDQILKLPRLAVEAIGLVDHDPADFTSPHGLDQVFVLGSARPCSPGRTVVEPRKTLRLDDSS